MLVFETLTNQEALKPYLVTITFMSDTWLEYFAKANPLFADAKAIHQACDKTFEQACCSYASLLLSAYSLMRVRLLHARIRCACVTTDTVPSIGQPECCRCSSAITWKAFEYHLYIRIESNEPYILGSSIKEMVPTSICRSKLVISIGIFSLIKYSLTLLHAQLRNLDRTVMHKERKVDKKNTYNVSIFWRCSQILLATLLDSVSVPQNNNTTVPTLGRT